MLLTRIRIVGPSMEPAVRNGDWWLARRTRAVSVGDAVVFHHPLRSGMIAVKRAVRRDGDGWWVEGDNRDFSDDSRQFGAIPVTSIIGRLVFRYRPLIRR